MKRQENLKVLNTVLVFVFIACFGYQANAQAAIFAALFGDKVASKKFNISMEIGVPLTNVGNIDGNKPNIGVNFGIAGNLKINDTWSVSPTAYFLSKRSFDMESFSLNSPDVYLNNIYTDVPTTISMNYIQMPIFVYYNIPNSNLRLGLAPQMSFKQNVDATFSADIGDFEQSVGIHANNIDYGLVANVSYYLKYKRNGKGLYVSLRYGQGFTDVFKDSFIDGNNKSHYFSFNISLPFITDELAQKNLGDQPNN
ncbi:porin family protein [Galbibacter pacificus]|uniref:Porin family protein n=1 Tax=Galbibacter pacificus TaxID=2996052 RepID=A0ABT6FQ13_9FLAO|nr:porin family protein [Galbibacter pacificus]MDG3582179.1 porin family protein [Galbibacter pacificus]MDG3585345.1 porin family protein [Galbibacter pacificus]